MADGIHHQVTPRVLDILLDSNRVTKFKRSGSWVTVGVGLIRAKRRNDYCPLHYGPDLQVSSEKLTSAEQDALSQRFGH